MIDSNVADEYFNLKNSYGTQDVINIFSKRTSAIMQRFKGTGQASLSNGRLLAALRALDEVHEYIEAQTQTRTHYYSCMRMLAPTPSTRSCPYKSRA